MDCTHLQRVIQTLTRLDAEGWLEDFREEVFAATRGPRGDLERHPDWGYQVGRYARMASQLFAVPVSQAHEAAIQVLLPETLQRTSLEILEQYEQRLDEQALKAQAQRRIQSFNRRVGA